MIGTPGAWWSISGYHYRKGRTKNEEGEKRCTLALTLSKDGGLTIEKQIRKTSVCGMTVGEGGRSLLVRRYP